MRLAVMIEGQEGVSWDDWLALAHATEAHGFEALLRSDHYLSVAGISADGALDAWGTICALATHTERLRLGTLVSPVTFRLPAVLAKLALTADHISGGRIDVGMGTGWNEPEHEAFEIPFPPLGDRMNELERQLEVVHRVWTETAPAPVQQPRPHLILGGAAKPRAARLAARWADEYNVIYETAESCARKRAAIVAACEALGRDPQTMTFSLMTGFVIGADDAEVRDRAARLAAAEGRTADELLDARRGTWLIGTPEHVAEQLAALERAGVQRVALQHLDHRDLDVLELIGRELVGAA